MFGKSARKRKTKLEYCQCPECRQGTDTNGKPIGGRHVTRDTLNRHTTKHSALLKPGSSQVQVTLGRQPHTSDDEVVEAMAPQDLQVVGYYFYLRVDN